MIKEKREDNIKVSVRRRRRVKKQPMKLNKIAEIGLVIRTDQKGRRRKGQAWILI